MTMGEYFLKYTAMFEQDSRIYLILQIFKIVPITFGFPMFVSKRQVHQCCNPPKPTHPVDCFLNVNPAMRTELLPHGHEAFLPMLGNKFQELRLKNFNALLQARHSRPLFYGT